MGKAKTEDADSLQKRRKLDLKSFFVLGVLALCGVTALIISLNILSKSYEKDIETGSASHLVEINHQVKSTIEKVIENDQKQAETMKQYIESDDGTNVDSLYEYTIDQLRIWNCQEIYFFNENGICVDSKGVVKNDTSATEFAAEILRNSSSYRINKSQLEYGVAVTSNTEIEDSKIVAVSITNDLNSLLDDMKIEFAPTREDKIASVTMADGSDVINDKTYTVALWGWPFEESCQGKVLQVYDESINTILTDAIHEKSTISPFTDDRLKVLTN